MKGRTGQLTILNTWTIVGECSATIRRPIHIYLNKALYVRRRHVLSVESGEMWEGEQEEGGVIAEETEGVGRVVRV